MRPAWKATISLAVGGGLTILTALACAVWSTTTKRGRWSATNAVPAQVPVAVPSGWMVRTLPKNTGVIDVGYEEFTGIGVLQGELQVGEFPRSGPSAQEHALCVWRVGWPCAAFERIAWVSDETATEPAQFDLERGLALDLSLLRPVSRDTHFGHLILNTVFRSYPSQTMIPVSPLPLGLAANGALFSILAGAAMFGPRSVIRMLRRRASRCVNCGYNRAGLAADAKCPECGTVLAPAST